MPRNRTRKLVTIPGIAAWMLAGIAAIPLPSAASDRSAEARPERGLTQQRTIRDQHGFRSGRADTHPDGRVTMRDARGFRTGEARPDSRGGYTLRNSQGFRTGRIDPPR